MSSSLDDRFPIVCFGDDWGQYQTSNQQLMQAFARRGCRVVWVNSIGARSPRPTLSDMRKIAWKLQASLRARAAGDENPLIISPLVLPLPQFAWARRFNVDRLSRQLKRILHDRGLDNPVLWICGPIAADFIGRLGERTAVYYCADEYAASPHAPAKAARQLEDVALRSADLTLVVSRRLLESKGARAKRIALLPHGVDAAHFGKALDAETRVPPDIARLPKPVAGYYGLLNNRIDWRLVDRLAELLPTWSFVLIGPTSGRLPRLGRPNVHTLGPRPYSALPSYVKGFDVAFIPYRTDDEFVRASSPLKVLELLAAGVPVVSTTIPDIQERHAAFVTIASDLDAFVLGLLSGVVPSSCGRVPNAARLARDESWDRRAGQAAKLLVALVSDRGPAFPPDDGCRRGLGPDGS